MAPIRTPASKLVEQFTRDLALLGVKDYIILLKDTDYTGELARFNGSTYWQHGAALDMANRCKLRSMAHWAAAADDNGGEADIGQGFTF